MTLSADALALSAALARAVEKEAGDAKGIDASGEPR